MSFDTNYATLAATTLFLAPSPDEGGACGSVDFGDTRIGFATYVAMRFLESHPAEAIAFIQDAIFGLAASGNEKAAVDALVFLSSLAEKRLSVQCGYGQLNFVAFLRKTYFALIFLERSEQPVPTSREGFRVAGPEDVPQHDFKKLVMTIIVNIWFWSSGAINQNEETEALACTTGEFMSDMACEADYLFAARSDLVKVFPGHGKGLHDFSYLPSDWEQEALANIIKSRSLLYTREYNERVIRSLVMEALLKLRKNERLCESVSDALSLAALKYGADVCRPGEPAKKSSKKSS